VRERFMERGSDTFRLAVLKSASSPPLRGREGVWWLCWFDDEDASYLAAGAIIFLFRDRAMRLALMAFVLKEPKAAISSGLRNESARPMTLA
jgi:hypothetical protein